MLTYSEYIFEQKINDLFLNINETDGNWVSDNEYEWDIPELDSTIETLPNKYKKILNSILKKVQTLINDIDLSKINMILNNIINKITSFVVDTPIRRKLIYALIVFILATTTLTINNITIADDMSNKIEVENIIASIENKKSNISVIDSVKLKQNNLKSQTEFLKKLAFKESSNVWDTVRYIKRKRDKKDIPAYVGKYQFGRIAFKDIKSNVTVQDFAKNPHIWPEEQQDKDVLKLINNNKHYLRPTITFKGYNHYVGKVINGVEITESGLLAAAHLVGHRGVKKFLRSNGEKDPVDGNKTPCSKYVAEFANYSI